MIARRHVIVSAFGIGAGIYHVSVKRSALVEHLNQFPTTGIALTAKALALVKRLDPFESDDAEFVRIGRFGKTNTFKVSGASDAHDIHMHRDKVDIVSSYRNAVIGFSLRDRAVVSEHILDPKAELDHWHPNDLCEIDGDQWVSCFADPKEGLNWHDQRDGRGFLLNLRTRERIGRFTFPHSPMPCPEGIYVCDSGTSSVVLIDQRGAELKRKQLSGFTRGLLIEHEFVLVGTSTHRLQATTVDSETESRIYILRRSDLAEVGIVDIPATEIYSIRLASPWQIKRLRQFGK